MDKIQEWWDTNAQQYQSKSNLPIDISYGPGAPNEEQLNLMGNLSGKDILEIGCGSAHCGIAFALQGAKVSGIDISEEQLKIARELIRKYRVDIRLFQGNMINLEEIASESQDIVFSSWTLQYIGDLSKCYQEVNRVLRRRGLFVFSLDHPFWRRIDKKDLKINKKYFEVGRYEEPYMGGTFVAYDKTVGDIVNPLFDSGFTIERLVEPILEERNVDKSTSTDQAEYRTEAQRWIPRTIIIKARKR